MESMKEAQTFAETLRQQIAAAHGETDSRAAVERDIIEGRVL